MRTRWMLLTAMGIAMPTAAWSNTYTDDFNDGMYGPMWAPWSVDAPIPMEQNGRMEFFLPGTSVGPMFSTGLRGAMRLCGDFDVKFTFDHPIWPKNNGVRTGMTLGNKHGAYTLERTSLGLGMGEQVLSDIGGNLTMMPYPMNQGSLRIRRVGMEMTGYVWDGEWQPLGTWFGAIGPMDVDLWVWSHDAYFGHQDVLATFDDFAAVDSASVVNGAVDLGDYIGPIAGQRIEILLVQDGYVVDSQIVTLDEFGQFQFATEVQGAVRVLAKGTHWLRRASPVIQIGPNGLQNTDFALTNGDVDGDNVIDSNDFDLLVVNFGEENFIGDLDGNTMVDSDDFDILVAHFGEYGD